MATLGSLTFADGGINGYERVDDSVHMVLHAFTSDTNSTSFTVTFHGVTHLVDADRWDEKIASERLTRDGEQNTLTLLDRTGQTMFAITFARFSIAESAFVPNVATLNITWPSGRAESTSGKPDYVYWIGAALIGLTMSVLVVWTIFRW